MYSRGFGIYWNILCPSGSSSSIFINIAISIAIFFYKLCPSGSSSSILINIAISIANFFGIYCAPQEVRVAFSLTLLFFLEYIVPLR